MSSDASEFRRRTLLQAAAGLAISQTGVVASGSAATSRNEVGTPKAEARAGSPGDFNFLAGEWKISHRRRKGDDKDWDEFEGEASCWTVLGGIGSIEELRIPARDFSGIGIRLLDVERKLWSDFWVNGRSGVLTTPGMTGTFADGVGTFAADEIEGDRPIKVRGVWDRITPTSCRWHQAVSRDDGQTWVPNWFMNWTRA